MCSLTRACLLTGRNHHTNGMGMISELASGYPGYDGTPKPSRAYISQILQAQGFATFALGKWHQVPAEGMSTAGPYTRWPVGKGFDRYCGFLGAETESIQPRSAVDQPATPSLVSEHPFDEVAMTLTLNAIRSDSAEANACTCHGEWRHIDRAAWSAAAGESSE